MPRFLDGEKIAVLWIGTGKVGWKLHAYDIGYFDLEACRVEPVDNPFGPKVLSMSPV